MKPVAGVCSVLCLLCLLLWIVSGAQANADVGCADGQIHQVTTSHSATLGGGRSVAYTATAGFIEVKATDNSAKACVFYTAYNSQTPQTMKTSQASAPRPVLFAFNGGPGSASFWLHLGFLGPKRVDMGPDGLTPPSHTGLIDNQYSPLDVSDIVVIDAVGTGFSTVEGTGPADRFFGVKNDYMAMASFIQNYLNTFNRWSSPKFILGESYGGIRGSLLTQHLQSDFGIAIDGLILISPALSDAPLSFSPDTTLGYWTNFASFATTAWFHHRTAEKYRTLSVEEVYSQARQFAHTELRDALDIGDALPPGDIERVAAEVSAFTGFSKERVIALGLKISPWNVFTELLGEQMLAVGRYDSRFKGPLSPAQPGQMSYDDPGLQIAIYPYVAGINEYLRSDLKLPLTVPYLPTADDIKAWPSEDGNTDETVIGNLSTALSDNPKLKVLINSGYFDLACPVDTVTYELSQLPNGANLHSRISQKMYPAGHMLYTNPQALSSLKAEVGHFIQNQSRLSLRKSIDPETTL